MKRGPTRLFLSHSSEDGEDVLRLAQDLIEAGVEVWYADWEIRVGEPIAEEVQRGIQSSSHLAIWLTPQAVSSGWVKHEWQAKFREELASDLTTVLPLLAGDCTMPAFLKNKKYADFRTDYEQGFKQLLAALKPGPAAGRPESVSILTHTRRLLEDLKDSVIPIPLREPIRILDSLKALPRTGKAIRLHGFEPPVPIRSVYDHMLSMAHTADCLLELLGARLVEPSHDLARYIVYHDVCEVLLGDLPDFTSASDFPEMSQAAMARGPVARSEKARREEVTNLFLALFLEPKQRRELMADPSREAARWVSVFDRIDPIVAVWRYLWVFRGKLGSGKKFVHRLADFFENPTVRVAVDQADLGKRLPTLVSGLQDMNRALEYYRDPSSLDALAEAASLPTGLVRKLVEGRKFEWASPMEDPPRSAGETVAV